MLSKAGGLNLNKVPIYAIDYYQLPKYVNVIKMSTELIGQPGDEESKREAAANLISSEIRPVEQALDDNEVESALQEEYQRLTLSIAVSRERAETFEALVGRARSQIRKDEQTLAELGFRLGERPEIPNVLLKGERILEVAISLIPDDVSVEKPIHYREWYRLIRNAGYYITGAQPLSNFLVQLSRSPKIQALGNRSGYYALTPDEPDDQD